MSQAFNVTDWRVVLATVNAEIEAALRADPSLDRAETSARIWMEHSSGERDLRGFAIPPAPACDHSPDWVAWARATVAANPTDSMPERSRWRVQILINELDVHDRGICRTGARR